MPSTCPLCGLAEPNCRISGRGDRDVAEISCQICGNFVVTPGHFSPGSLVSRVPRFLREKGVLQHDLSRANELLKAYLSIYTRECSESGRPPELLNFMAPNELERLAETYAYTPVSRKSDKLLRLLEARTPFPGSRARFFPAYDYSAIHALNSEEAVYYVRVLAEGGYIEAAELQRAFSRGITIVDSELLLVITFSGWERLAPMRGGSDVGFVAMSFAEDMQTAFRSGIEPGIRDAGYEPLRIDRIHHNEKICDRIVAEIRRSRFLVADVTGQRPGVYFEAGFAMGLGQQVIWSCKNDDFSRVHFDTRQYNHIVWETPEKLREQLRDRIRATVGLRR
jgi:nucleoside 2-deoxyribosyltransferase